MKMFHKSRKEAREASKRTGLSVSDMGTKAPIGKRWAIDFKKKGGK